MDRFDLSEIRTKPQMCLIFFIIGGIVCVILDLLGVSSISDKTLLRSSVEFPLPVQIIIPVIYIAFGIMIGLFSICAADAAIYGACVGQCQFLLPIVIHYLFLHNGSDFDIWWRALCGPILALSFAGAVFNIKKLLKGRQ